MSVILKGFHAFTVVCTKLGIRFSLTEHVKVGAFIFHATANMMMSLLHLPFTLIFFSALVVTFSGTAFVQQSKTNQWPFLQTMKTFSSARYINVATLSMLST